MTPDERRFWLMDVKSYSDEDQARAWFALDRDDQRAILRDMAAYRPLWWMVKAWWHLYWSHRFHSHR